MIQRLQGLDSSGQSILDPEFDLLIVGAGATGVGCALDAASRGLKVALVERDDFSCGSSFVASYSTLADCLRLEPQCIGTSSRSTKLVHGGVRYLEKAFLELDIEQYKLVREALHERGIFLKVAPYLAHELPIMLPIYECVSAYTDFHAHILKNG
jgi:glycerol-3-phosphate dehydrogenase